MPKIYEYLGLIFFFYSNEHLPIHVHVSFGGYENKIELKYENGKLKKLKALEVKGRKGLPPKEIKNAIKFVEIYHREIINKWTLFFVMNQKISCEVIKHKL